MPGDRRQGEVHPDRLHEQRRRAPELDEGEGRPAQAAPRREIAPAPAACRARSRQQEPERGQRDVDAEAGQQRRQVLPDRPRSRARSRQPPSWPAPARAAREHGLEQRLAGDPAAAGQRQSLPARGSRAAAARPGRAGSCRPRRAAGARSRRGRSRSSRGTARSGGSGRELVEQGRQRCGPSPAPPRASGRAAGRRRRPAGTGDDDRRQGARRSDAGPVHAAISSSRRRASRRSAARRARAAMVAAGFTERAGDDHAAVDDPQVRDVVAGADRASTTEVSGSSPIRQVPSGCQPNSRHQPGRQGADAHPPPSAIPAPARTLKASIRREFSSTR